MFIFVNYTHAFANEIKKNNKRKNSNITSPLGIRHQLKAKEFVDFLFKQPEVK